ncbi:hypothetical protein [Algoriphagus sp. Y33]|uniref:hypothetical protein n=1 Tax=Algoriphagus sp. Y33 TaxID=2772483 RepID=UPI00177F50A5|nr:hypothetical protein [Algoriphagus sp. Y33]
MKSTLSLGERPVVIDTFWNFPLVIDILCEIRCLYDNRVSGFLRHGTGYGHRKSNN